MSAEGAKVRREVVSGVYAYGKVNHIRSIYTIDTGASCSLSKEN